MSVPREVSLDVLRAELEVAAQYAAAAGIVLDAKALTADNLRFYLGLHNAAGEQFMVEFDCRDYPLHPPLVEFVSLDRSQRGLPRLYPTGFHPTPCVCMRYNRKAYSDVGGPHSEWRLVDWRLPTSAGIAVDTLAMMVSDLDAKTRQAAGRMG